MKAYDNGKMLCDEVLSYKSYISKCKAMGPEISSANYQQEPIDLKGRLYSNLKIYSSLQEFIKIKAYTDTADTGDDFLCHIVYGETREHEAYLLDVIYTKEPMEITEPLVAKSLYENKVNVADIESNNGGRGFARAVERKLKEIYRSNKTRIKWFHQSKNKQARILSNSTWIMDHVYFPKNWQDRWPHFAKDLLKYQKEGKNKHDDGPDALTGVAEKCNNLRIDIDNFKLL